MFSQDNDLDLSTYLKLRYEVGWKTLTEEQAKRAIENSLYTVVVYDNDEPIGMGRIVGDGAVICYIQDLIVIPQYQKQGVGHMIMESLIDYVNKIKIPDTDIMLDLMCAKGRESFYKRYGFIARPTEQLGPGMILYINGETK
ncbi:GNAT family N-acetyltransferase [uncultured Eubacterium sp.]|uniref:GNAT family N-acetyltransferase n=1 Tax=uncultured Eubacterium sp. TaxID=165185 RepID=UPI002671D3A7|nr:GNAT family N-acetyltransferase [uncultured Eubacterium sp.]